MSVQRALLGILALSLAAWTPAASATMLVWLDPAAPTVAVGDTVTVDIKGTFDESVVTWGLDLTVGDPTYAAWINTAIGVDWDVTDTLDHDGLSGMRFATGVAGDVLLATLTFEGLAEGVTTLTLSSGPEEDEGILLEMGGLATNVQFAPATLTVVPEPGSLALLGFGALAALLRKR